MAAQFSRMLWLFAPILVILNLVMPAFSYGDDIDHIRKAYTVAHLEFPAGLRPSGAFVDGHVDTNLELVIERERPYLRGNRRAMRAELAILDTRETPWAGTTVAEEVPGGIHFPLIYVPQAAGLAFGQAARMTVENSVLLSRLLNGFAALGLIALSFRMLPVGVIGSTLVFLAFPKTLLSFASNSLDPLLISGVLLTLALTFRATTLAKSSPIQWLLIAGSIITVACVRPPLLSLALIPGTVAVLRKDRSGIAAIVLSVLITLSWSVLISPGIQDPRCTTPTPLIDKILRMTLNGPELIWRSLLQNGQYYYFTMIGEVGWGSSVQNLFTPLPMLIYAMTIPMLVLSLYFVCATESGPPRATRLASVSAAALYAAGVFLTVAVGCTAVSGTVITGIQGRYFLPLLPLVGFGLAGVGRANEALLGIFKATLLGYLLICTAFTVNAGLYFYWAR